MVTNEYAGVCMWHDTEYRSSSFIFIKSFAQETLTEKEIKYLDIYIIRMIIVDDIMKTGSP